MADALWPLAWFLFGPFAGLLSSPWTVIPTVTAVCVPALFLGAGLGAGGDRLITTVLTRPVAAPDHSTSHRTPETRRETR